MPVTYLCNLDCADDAGKADAPESAAVAEDTVALAAAKQCKSAADFLDTTPPYHIRPSKHTIKHLTCCSWDSSKS